MTKLVARAALAALVLGTGAVAATSHLGAAASNASYQVASAASHPDQSDQNHGYPG